MKLLQGILSIVLIGSAIAGHSQVTNKDEMVKKIFVTLKNKDEEGFIKLFPDGATIRNFFLKSMGADSTLKPGMKESIDQFMKMMTDSSLEAGYRGDFEKFISKGEKKGVDWADATLVSFTADSTIQEEDGLKMAELAGKIYFNSNKKEYYMAFNEVIWFDNRGWYGVDIKKLDEKSKESMTGYEPDEDDEFEARRIADADSIAMVDSVTRPDVKKPVQKPAAKQPVKSSAKPKTQSPAKKPD